MKKQITLQEANCFGLPVSESRLIMPIEGSMIGKWDHWLEPFIGKDWCEVPAWVGEAWYFRQLLAEGDYFEAGSPAYMVDPWSAEKSAEKWLGEPEKKQIEDWLDNQTLPVGLHSLSSKIAGNTQNIRIASGKVGRELLESVLLISNLLSSERVEKVVLDCLQFPLHHQVTARDYIALITWLFQSGGAFFQFAMQLNNWTAEGRLAIHTLAWWNSPCYFDQMAVELKKLYAQADLAILIGGLNHRRLTLDKPPGDSHSFPCPFYLMA